MAYIAEFDPEREPQRFQVKPPPQIVFDDGAVYRCVSENRPTDSEVTRLRYELERASSTAE